MKYSYIVRAVSEHIQTEGVPSRMVCPACLGGSDHEECMTVYESEEGGVLATCHRANCEVQTVGLGYKWPGAFDEPKYSDKTTPVQQWNRMWVDANPFFVKEVEQEYKVYLRPALRHYIRLYSWPHEDRLLLAITDSKGQQRGFVSRALDKNRGKLNSPKAVTYVDPLYRLGLAYFHPHEMIGKFSSPINSDIAVVVEDAKSAIALSNVAFISTVSLNGTHLNEDRICDLMRAFDRIILCLDADATSKAIKYVRKYCGRYNITTVRLEKDFKDMNKREINKWAKRYLR